MSASSVIVPLPAVLRKKKVFSRSRSTSGCLTCKSRRVKCDETKPSCLRCLQFETDCAGYGSSQMRDKTPRKVQSRLPPLLPCIAGRNQLFLLQPSRDFSFPYEAQGRYFLVFRDEVVPELTGVLGSPLWNRTILQACHSESFVREAVVALAALRMSLSPACAAASNDFSAQHYRFALQEYGKAIRSVREALASSNKKSEIRKALVGCLLFFCFESFQGSRELALSHAKSGYQLLEDWLASKSSPYSRAEVLSSPEPTVIEDDLLHAFYRLDLQVMTIDASRPFELHSKASTDGASVVAHMPLAFSDLNEAHRYWLLVMRRNHHFVHSALAEARGLRSKSALVDEVGGNLGNIGSLIHSYYPSERFSTLQVEHASYAAEIIRWQVAFRTLLSSPGGRINPGVAILQIHSVSSQINLDMLVIRKDDFASYTEKFREIVMLARSIIASTSISASSERQSFSIDFGIIPSLFVVIYLCQDEAIRGEAMSVLYSSQRREGIWNSLDRTRKGK